MNPSPRPGLELRVQDRSDAMATTVAQSSHIYFRGRLRYGPFFSYTLEKRRSRTRLGATRNKQKKRNRRAVETLRDSRELLRCSLYARPARYRAPGAPA